LDKIVIFEDNNAYKQLSPKAFMEQIITSVESNLDKCQEFLFKLRKFFSKNPDISEKFVRFLQEKEELVF
jgi:hypothetical protein